MKLGWTSLLILACTVLQPGPVMAGPWRDLYAQQGQQERYEPGQNRRRENMRQERHERRQQHRQMSDEERRELHRDLDKARREIYRPRRER